MAKINIFLCSLIFLIVVSSLVPNGSLTKSKEFKSGADSCKRWCNSYCGGNGEEGEGKCANNVCQCCIIIKVPS
ncbi:hypothetical protein C5167_014769 [Papaver somniferum]|uniref:Knottin scorpion toxin-like domain-containing protein n=1 Tax=Papaver somniferum TaxID=3469 RepID=A0A4Y7J8G5_PAPSO|nr:hypothetical protein C5167_014769 [Papaver somniferum]